MDGTVPVEVTESGVNHPRQGMPVCSGCPCAGSNPRRGFMFNGLPKHCRARCATPHGVVGNAASPTATDREPLTGFGARSGTSSRYRYGSPDGLWKDTETSPSPICRNRRRHPQGRSPPPSQPLIPWPAPSVTAVTRLPVPHRLQPPRFRHPHRADGQHGAGGSTGVRGESSPSGDACL